MSVAYQVPFLASLYFFSFFLPLSFSLVFFFYLFVSVYFSLASSLSFFPPFSLSVLLTLLFYLFLSVSFYLFPSFSLSVVVLSPIMSYWIARQTNWYSFVECAPGTRVWEVKQKMKRWTKRVHASLLRCTHSWWWYMSGWIGGLPNLNSSAVKNLPPSRTRQVSCAAALLSVGKTRQT